MQQFDVVVVGKGNAALCAALAARDDGASACLLEAANVDESGGNSRFAGGVMRFIYNNVDDLRKLTDLTDEEAAAADWESNTVEQFYDDLYQVTNYRTDPALSELLITRSFDTMVWLRSQGGRTSPETGQVVDVNFHPIPGLYAAGEMVGGIFYFNYPARTGLVSGCVFGKIAGNGAASAVAAE